MNLIKHCEILIPNMIGNESSKMFALTLTKIVAPNLLIPVRKHELYTAHDVEPE